jgi:bacterioferritin-associated ferredoxin
MDACHTRNSCTTCPGRVICHCLQVTEDMLVEALITRDLRTVTEIRQHTGAGDGCTACHRRLASFLERQTVSLAVLQSSSS